MRIIKIVAINVVVSVLVLELALQVIAFLNSKNTRDGNFESGESIRVLTMGDSNTYGLFVEDFQAWPKQVEKHWNEEYTEQKLEVVNLGFTGTTSTRLLKNLPKALETFKPDYVFVMIGVNDWWHPPVDVGDGISATTEFMHWLYTHSKIFKFIYMYQKNKYSPEQLHVDKEARLVGLTDQQMAEYREKMIDGKTNNITIEDIPEKDSPISYNKEKFDVGYVFKWNKDTDPDPIDVLTKSLDKIVAEVSKTSSQLVFVEYPSNYFIYAVASDLLRKASEKYQVPIILVNKELIALCAQEDLSAAANNTNPANARIDTQGCSEYFVPDQHPNVKGHQVTGRLIADKFHQLISGNKN